MNDPQWVPAVHDDGRRILVGPVRTEAGVRRLVANIISQGWCPGEPMRRMSQQAWFEMAYFERAAVAAEKAGRGETGA